MIFNLRPTIFHKQDNSTSIRRLDIQFLAYMLLFIFLLSGESAQAESKKNYLQIQRSLATENNDLTVTSIGGLLLDKNAVTHIGLSYLESDANGKGLTLDVGGSYMFRWEVSFFVGMGGSPWLQLG